MLKNGYIEMTKKIYLETLKSVLGHSNRFQKIKKKKVYKKMIAMVNNYF